MSIHRAIMDDDAEGNLSSVVILDASKHVSQPRQMDFELVG